MTKTKKTLERAMTEAGAILKKAFYQKKSIEYKSPIDLVTKTDRGIERKITQIIRKSFPDHSILGEEYPPSGTAHQKWIIDPIDGTTNFAHGLPACCVSIGYEEEGKLKLGGVFNPVMDEWFWAERGKGASLNGKKIKVTKTKKVLNSLLVTGFPYDRNKRAAYYLKFYEEFVKNSHGIRRLGSAALDLCYVACGRFDAYWEFNLNPWDIAAGVLIAEEAGGKLTDFSGKPINIYEKELLACNPNIHREMLRRIKKHL